MSSAHDVSGWLWDVWLVYWLFAARHTKPAATVEPRRHRLMHGLGMLVAFLLLYAPAMQRQPRLFPATDAIDATGILLELAGMGFTVWARLQLGANWSGTVQLKHDHELIVDGPYRLTRHPIYSGLLLAFIGAWMTIATLPGLAGFVVLWATVAWKSTHEDALMRHAFPDIYPAYAARVKRLVPGLF